MCNVCSTNYYTPLNNTPFQTLEKMVHCLEEFDEAEVKRREQQQQEKEQQASASGDRDGGGENEGLLDGGHLRGALESVPMPGEGNFSGEGVPKEVGKENAALEGHVDKKGADGADGADTAPSPQRKLRVKREDSTRDEDHQHISVRKAKSRKQCHARSAKALLAAEDLLDQGVVDIGSLSHYYITKREASRSLASLLDSALPAVTK